MSSAIDVEAKNPYRESATAIDSKYAIDGIVEDGGSDPSLRYGETRNDQKDMHRMGKDQELMVNNFLSFVVVTAAKVNRECFAHSPPSASRS